MAAPNPLQRYLLVQGTVDRGLERALRDAAAESERIIKRLAGDDSVTAAVRRSQYNAVRRALLKHQQELWGTVDTELRAGMHRVGAQAAEAENLWDNRLFNTFGGPIPELQRAQHAAAQATIDNYIARTANELPLSAQVYHSQALASGQVSKEIGRSLLLGEGWQQLSARVTDLIRPDVPGGVSYSAKRLARTELNNAFHHAQIAQNQDKPWVLGFKWILSGSHPKPDECNEYAEKSHFKDGDPGVFLKEEVPGKPHPNCLCYLLTVQKDDSDMVADFMNGRYNSHIDSKVYQYAREVSPCR